MDNQQSHNFGVLQFARDTSAVVLRFVTNKAIARAIIAAANVADETLRHVVVAVSHVTLKRPDAQKSLIANGAHSRIAIRTNGIRRSFCITQHWLIFTIKLIG